MPLKPVMNPEDKPADNEIVSDYGHTVAVWEPESGGVCLFVSASDHSRKYYLKSEEAAQLGELLIRCANQSK
jgi:hypothetical protein